MDDGVILDLSDGATGGDGSDKGPTGRNGGPSDDVPDGVSPDELRGMWQRFDPVPAGLLDRVCFALQVDEFSRDDLELELMRLQSEGTSLAGARGGDEVRTVTFGSESLTVMLAISDVSGGYRIDGWVAPGGARRLEVRTADGSRREVCDESGRFVLDVVPHGHFQLVLDGEDLGGSIRPGSLARAVVTPALTL